MNLFRINAYFVDPSRTSERYALPQGGRISLGKDLVKALDRNYKAAKFQTRPSIDFNVDPQTRTNPVRDSIIQFAFQGPSKADDAALTLATRLSQTMDLRSKPSLFIVMSLKDGDKRRVIAWTFPRDEAFRLSTKTKAPSLQILTDIFSQSSSLRKAAMFEGRNLRNGFLSGTVLDLQTGLHYLEIANFWVEEFLMCKLGLLGAAGTRILADALKHTASVAENPVEKEQVFATMLSLKHSPKRDWTFQEIADQYLSGRVKSNFLSALPNQQTVNSQFVLEKPGLERELKFRIFSLDTGVFVSSPMEEVGKSVNVSDDDQRKLECQGVIVDEKVRARHG